MGEKGSGTKRENEDDTGSEVNERKREETRKSRGRFSP